MQYLRETEKALEAEELTDEKIKSLRNQWEKRFIKAKSLVWLCEDNVLILKKPEDDIIDFEI